MLKILITNFVAFCIVQVILSVAFLWQVLGWRYEFSLGCFFLLLFTWALCVSALLGVLTMVITLPVPTLLSKLLLTTQRKKMERVSTLNAVHHTSTSG